MPAPIPAPTFGAVVRTLAAERGLTISALARETGLHPVSLRHLLADPPRRGDPGLGTALRLCRALGCSLSVFDGIPLAEKSRKKSV